MLAPVNEKGLQQEVYLNFNHRPQRIVISNALVFLWSISSLLYYSNLVSPNPINRPFYSDATNSLLVTYYLLMSIASTLTLFFYYYRLKIKEIGNVHCVFSIAGDPVELTVESFVHIIIGLLYFLCVILHFGATWNMCGDICEEMDEKGGCIFTMISTTLIAVVFPLFLAMDLVDNYFRNPNKRILAAALLVFLSCLIYIFEFQNNDWGKDTYYIASYLRFSQSTLYLISAGTSAIFVMEGVC